MALKYLYAPSGVKAGTAYGVLPNSASADFSSFVSDTDGTRVDKNGFITDVEANVPRIDYTGGGCPSLLLEEASTNITQYSEDFTQSYWTKEGNATIESNVEISPTGSLNASYLKVSAVTGSPRINQTFGCASGQTYTGSVFVKKDNVDYIRLLSTGATASTLNAYYNVSNGTLGTSGNADKAKIEDYGNGWYRLSLIIDAVNNTGGATFRIQLAKGDGVPISTYDGTEKNIIFGAQLEQQPYATSYIPNYGTAAGVTRSQEASGYTGDISVDIDSGEGVFFAEIAYFDADQQGFPHMSISDGTADNRISIQKQSSTTNAVAFTVRDSNVGQCFLQESTINKSNYFKVAGKYKQDEFALFINGSKINTDTSGSVPTGLNTFSFDKGNTFSKFFGRVRQIRIYDEVLSDNELEELTTL